MKATIPAKTTSIFFLGQGDKIAKTEKSGWGKETQVELQKLKSEKMVA
jgi:hypothetical protein